METHTTAANQIIDEFFIGLIIHLSSVKMPLQKQLNIQLAENFFQLAIRRAYRNSALFLYFGLTDDLR